MKTKLTVTFFFAWYDMWIGHYRDRERHISYICPLPCCVFKFERIPVCEHPGCRSQDVVECSLYDSDNQEYLTEYYCTEHRQKHGYCWGCGHFWAGCESFDFSIDGLCPECHDDPDLVGYDEPDDEWLVTWEDYPGDLLASGIDFDLRQVI